MDTADQPLQLTRCPTCDGAAEITRRTVLESTDGPIEHVGVRCVYRHWFLMPASGLDRPAPSPQRAPSLDHAPR